MLPVLPSAPEYLRFGVARSPGTPELLPVQAAQRVRTPLDSRIANDLALQGRALLPCFLCGYRGLFPSTVNTSDRERPARNQINSGHQFGGECWEEFPVPAQQVNQHGSDQYIEHVVSGRQSTSGKQGKNENLKGVGRHGQDQGGAKTPSWRGKDWVFRCSEVCAHIALF